MSGLDDYARPSVAVDPVILTVYRGTLSVVLDHSDPSLPRLPGTFVHEGETLEQAVARGLGAKLGIVVPHIEQLKVFDAPGRDPRGWVISVAHYSLVAESSLDALRPKDVVPVDELRELAFDHEQMVADAVKRIRADYLNEPDPWRVLRHFTLSELRAFHESIDPTTHLRDTFRRVMEPQLIELTDVPPLSTGGRPSRVWRTPDEVEKNKLRFGTSSSDRAPKRVARSESLSRSVRPDAARTFFAAMKMPSDAIEPVSYSRPSRKPAPRFTVEFAWSDGERKAHENLREREAIRLFDDFVYEAKTALTADLSVRALSAVMRDERGEVVRSLDLA